MQTPGLNKLQQIIERQLNALHDSQQWRSLRPLARASLRGIDLTHNDYLGLRTDPLFQERAYRAAQSWPLGAGASRLLGGEHRIYEELEERFAEWKGCEAALYFSSGYAANEALMQALQQEGAIFFSDALNHASLIDGMRMPRREPSQKHIFRHNDWRDLERALQRSHAPLKLIITESLFSMDGDFCPMLELNRLCQEYQALLVVDEAHSLGVYGAQGAGYAAACGIDSRSIITINPCGKAMAAAGAFICGPHWLRHYLINTARGFIYSTGPSPWIAAALHEGLPYIAGLDERRQNLQQMAGMMRQALRAIGFDIGASASHIIPIIVGSAAAALQAELFLHQKGIITRAIRPPTVPAAACRLRLSLHAALDQDALVTILSAFKELRHALS